MAAAPETAGVALASAVRALVAGVADGTAGAGACAEKHRVVAAAEDLVDVVSCEEARADAVTAANRVAGAKLNAAAAFVVAAAASSLEQPVAES